MKWFKHDGNARSDEKIEKLLMKYGVEGYGLYFYCVEIIAGNLSSENITFDLKHDAETIAYRLKMDTLRVEEIIKWCVNAELFQYNHATERIMCLGLGKRLDVSTAQNPEIKKIINNYQKLLDTNSRIEENRIEENRVEYAPDVLMTPGEYNKLVEEYEEKYIVSLLHRMSQYIADKDKTYKSHYRTALNWIKRDERENKAVKVKKKKICPNCGKPWNGYSCHECLHESEESKNARAV